jgi:hypothetical protein
VVQPRAKPFETHPLDKFSQLCGHLANSIDCFKFIAKVLDEHFRITLSCALDALFLKVQFWVTIQHSDKFKTLKEKKIEALSSTTITAPGSNP